MDHNKILKIAVYSLLFITPLYIAGKSFSYFNTTSSKISSDLASQKGDVAGTSRTLDVENIPKEIPILENSSVLSIDTNTESTSITIDTNQNSDKVSDFYKNHFVLNGWKEENKNIFTKDKSKITINIDDNLVVINYTK